MNNEESEIIMNALDKILEDELNQENMPEDPVQSLIVSLANKARKKPEVYCDSRMHLDNGVKDFIRNADDEDDRIKEQLRLLGRDLIIDLITIFDSIDPMYDDLKFKIVESLVKYYYSESLRAQTFIKTREYSPLCKGDKYIEENILQPYFYNEMKFKYNHKSLNTFY